MGEAALPNNSACFPPVLTRTSYLCVICTFICFTLLQPGTPDGARVSLQTPAMERISAVTFKHSFLILATCDGFMTQCHAVCFFLNRTSRKILFHFSVDPFSLYLPFQTHLFSSSSCTHNISSAAVVPFPLPGSFFVLVMYVRRKPSGRSVH